MHILLMTHITVILWIYILNDPVDQNVMCLVFPIKSELPNKYTRR